MDTDLRLRIFEMRDLDYTHKQIADQLTGEGTPISRASVGRILAGKAQEAPAGVLVARVDALAETLGELDAAGRVRLEWLRALAVKGDQLVTLKTANSGVALANLTSRFTELVNELSGSSQSVVEQIRELITEDPDKVTAERDRYRTYLQIIGSGKGDGSPEYMKPRHTADEMQELAHTALNGSPDDPLAK